MKTKLLIQTQTSDMMNNRSLRLMPRSVSQLTAMDYYTLAKQPSISPMNQSSFPSSYIKTAR